MNPSISIRNATPEDISLLVALAEATWEPTYRSILSPEQIAYMFGVIYTPEALLRQLHEGHTFLLLYEAAEAVGFASFAPKDAANGVFKLQKLYLLPRVQGKGYGKVLLQAVEAQVTVEGGKVLDLNVNRYNIAKAFYERCGFREHLQEDIPIGPYWMNDFVMRKEL